MTDDPRTAEGMTLIGAMFSAPMIGIRQRWPDVLHAVTMEEIVRAWPGKRPNGTRPRRLPVAACGVSGVRLLGPSALWPPKLAGMPEGKTRCSACHEATGRKRPRSQFANPNGAER